VKSHTPVKIAAGFLGLSAIVLVGMLKAQDYGEKEGEEARRIRIGFEIAPVPLNLNGKDRKLVGLGSYWVNGVSDCNFCHTSGGPPNLNFANGFNPYFGQKKKTDPTTYLAGGTDFGPAVFPVPGIYPPAEYGSYVGPDIITRNLTPDKFGRAEGGRTRAQFMEIIRTGHDLDHIHPTCTSASPNPTPANCIPPPVDGNLLQVMPWPDMQDMSDHDIEALYEYLSAIPCIDNTSSPPPAGAPNELRNDCGDDPQVVGNQDRQSAARLRAKP
jgi:hypothetical protein